MTTYYYDIVWMSMRGLPAVSYQLSAYRYPQAPSRLPIVILSEGSWYKMLVSHLLVNTSRREGGRLSDGRYSR